MPVFDLLRNKISDGETDFPVLVGIESAKTLDSLSWAPALPKGTQNYEFAEKLSPNMDRWQRRLKEDRVDTISELYSRRNEIMPNPVVLAVAIGSEDQVKPSLQPWGVRLTLPDLDPDADEAEKPLWILDGQHRIKGIADIEDSDNPIPFVLLANLDEGLDPYKPSHFAKIFAQISTSPAPLTKVHSESLYFAFDLEHYGRSGQKSKRKKAMNTTKWLCYDGQSMLHNKITFDPSEPKSSEPFGWANWEWAGIIYKHFFEVASYDPGYERLGEAISQALRAAYKKLPEPGTSALFGVTSSSPEAYGRLPVQEGFIKALLEYMAQKPENLDKKWGLLFDKLKFAETNWDLTDLSTGGEAGTRAPILIQAMFREGLNAGTFPGDITLSDWLRGADPTEVQIGFCQEDPETGRALGPNAGDLPKKPLALKADTREEVKLKLDQETPFLFVRASANLRGFRVSDPNRRPDSRGFQGSKEQALFFLDWEKLMRFESVSGVRSIDMETFLYGDNQRAFRILIRDE